MSKMNPEIKAKWVAALRSGKYTQDKGQLRTENGHCCLGVLCEVLGVSYEPYDPDLSQTAANELVSVDVQENLAQRNDGIMLFSRGKQTFAQIADHIEANL